MSGSAESSPEVVTLQLDEIRRRLDDFADRMRHRATAKAMQRAGIGEGHGWLEWAMLAESERNHWRDLATASLEALP